MARAEALTAAARAGCLTCKGEGCVGLGFLPPRGCPTCKRVATLLLQHVQAAERRTWDAFADAAREVTQDFETNCGEMKVVLLSDIAALHARGPADAT